MQPSSSLYKEAVSRFEPMTNQSPKYNFTAVPGHALTKIMRYHYSKWYWYLQAFLPGGLLIILIITWLILSVIFQEDPNLYTYPRISSNDTRRPVKIKFVICIEWSKNCIFWWEVAWYCFSCCPRGYHLYNLFATLMQTIKPSHILKLKLQ